MLSLAPPSPSLDPCVRPPLRAPRRPLLPVITAAAAAASRRKRSEDGYHATIKSLNSKGRHTPRKSLGQHYMLDSSINEELSSVAGVEDGDVVLEIGPGTGSLTNVLINAGAMVIAVEKVLVKIYLESVLMALGSFLKGILGQGKKGFRGPFTISQFPLD